MSMDYEKIYKEALERARKLYDKWIDEDGKDVAFMIFPELKESKGERIRKHLIGVVELYYGKTDEQEKKDCLAWLEKQGYASETMNEKGDFDNGFTRMMEKEQKPAWSEEDEEKMNWIIATLNNCSMRNSESLPMNESCEDWLKSLRPQSHWKPSKRQKEALLWCVVHLGGADKQTLGELLEELNKL